MNIAKAKKQFDHHELQNHILGALQKEKHLVAVHLTNGPMIMGRIKRVDMYTVTVSGEDGKYYLLYKHGIAGFAVEAPIFRNMKFESDAMPND